MTPDAIGMMRDIAELRSQLKHAELERDRYRAFIEWGGNMDAFEAWCECPGVEAEVEREEEL